MTENEIVVIPTTDVRLGSISAENPKDVIVRATAIAKDLADIITKRKLFTIIKGRKFTHVEGWSTLGAMLGIVPQEVSVVEKDNGDFEATVELVRVSDGAVIGRGSSICGMDEDTWKSRQRYARRSMAITRATGKAFRLGFSWIMTLAGFEPTPAEEMPQQEPTSETAPTPAWMEPTYEEASAVTFSMKGVEKPLGSMSAKQLQWIIDNTKSAEKIAAATIVLKHDFSQARPEQTA